MAIFTIITIIVALIAQLVFGIKVIDFMFSNLKLFITVAVAVILLRVLFMFLPALMSLALSIVIGLALTLVIRKFLMKW